MTAPDDPALTAWLDARQAEVEHDHRPNAGITRTSCYCDVPEPCEDRIQQLAAIEGLRAILTRSAELVAENMRMHRERDALLDGNQRLQTMNDGLRQTAIQAREAAEGWQRATIDLYSGREEPHPADCPCGQQEAGDADVRAVAELLESQAAGKDMAECKHAFAAVRERFADRIAALAAQGEQPSVPGRVRDEQDGGQESALFGDECDCECQPGQPCLCPERDCYCGPCRVCGPTPQQPTPGTEVSDR